MNSVHKIWQELEKPKKKNGYSIRRFNDTNLFIAKTIDDRFVVLVEGIPNLIHKSYENLEIENINELITNDRKKLNRILSIKTGKHNLGSKVYNKVNPGEFAKTFDACFDKKLRAKKLLDIDDIKEILKKIQEFTNALPGPSFEEIVGLWGELYFIEKLLHNCSSSENAKKIIEGWEGVNGKTIIDFNFKDKKTQVEIKTTSGFERVHHFLSINQLQCQKNFNNGFLASIKIKQDKKNGISCKDLVSIVENHKLFDNNLKRLFELKLEFKGEKYYKNENYCFIFLDMSFMNFKDVPKPKIDKFIIDVSWEANLSALESKFLDKDKNKQILKLFS